MHKHIRKESNGQSIKNKYSSTRGAIFKLSGVPRVSFVARRQPARTSRRRSRAPSGGRTIVRTVIRHIDTSRHPLRDLGESSFELDGRPIRAVPRRNSSPDKVKLGKCQSCVGYTSRGMLVNKRRTTERHFFRVNKRAHHAKGEARNIKKRRAKRRPTRMLIVLTERTKRTKFGEVPMQE